MIVQEKHMLMPSSYQIDLISFNAFITPNFLNEVSGL